MGLDVLPERFTDDKIREQLDVETNVPGEKLNSFVKSFYLFFILSLFDY